MMECLYRGVCWERACHCRLADHTTIDKRIYDEMREECKREAKAAEADLHKYEVEPE